MTKKIIELKLKILAKLILRKYKPQIIGITGSVGKTSTREAVYAVLSGKFKVRRNLKNYNNEIGLPLTIIGAKSPGKSLLGWCLVSLKALWLLVMRDKEYPQILILEMGVDKPGDMDYLNSIVKCHMGIITTVGTVHAEYFKNREALRKEKVKLLASLSKDSYAIINYDNKGTKKILDEVKTKTISFGREEGADVRANNVNYSFDKKGNTKTLKGLSFKLWYKDSVIPIMLNNALGSGAVYASLAGAAVGLAYGLNLVEISKALTGFRQPPGRMNLVAGNKGTFILDDSYNAEPKSVLAALGTLKSLPLGNKRIVVLGDMLELGKYSEESHKDIGKYIAKSNIDVLIVVGEKARDIARGAKENGFSTDKVFQFPDSVSAGKFLEGRIKTGDLILIKGSQGARMEKIVLEIMADPLKAKDLLVRQDKQWQDK